MKSHSKQSWDALGDAQQRERLLLEQLPLVRLIARRIHGRLPRHVVLDDLVQAGTLGLIDALEKYDRNKHVQFGTYAKFRIQGAILDSLRELDWGPRSLRKMARQAEGVRSSLRCLLAREPSESEVAERLGISLRDFQILRQQVNGLNTVNFHAASEARDRSEELIDDPASPPEESPYCIRLRAEVRHLLGTLISQLPERQREVLNLYYQQNLTMREIGLALGVGESRISQLHLLAVTKLRALLECFEPYAEHTNVGPPGRLLQPW